MAKEALENGDRENQFFSNSSINDTILSFKSNNKESIKINYETSLHGVPLDGDDLVTHTTYDQILNLTYDKLATFDYIFIDESHALTSDMSFRSDTIASLIYHLIEFVAKDPDSKTKIIFMSGTPNVEIKVIFQIMKEYRVENLFQRIVVDKEYGVTPTVHLTHLDTTNKAEREDAFITQIGEYLKGGRKVCYIFNNKDKMGEVERMIQTKLSNKIKVGLFYSGSTGECTQNILSGKFGDYDVVLTTDYFVNGININKDGLTEEEIKAGIVSTQKYAVIVDIGSRHSHINAMNTIQAINRFRNRLCEATVFFPKIFKKDDTNSERKFHFGNAARVLLGINRYNFHLLSINENTTPNSIEEEDKEEKLHFIDKFRNNPLNVCEDDIKDEIKKEENRSLVKSKISREARIYEDWYFSLDGYHYLCKDAGFHSVFKHKDQGEPLKELSEKHIILENEVIKNFIENKEGVDSIYKKTNFDKRVIISASNKVLDPSDTNIGNFSLKEYKNNTYYLTGDFHSSHERAVNKLFICYSKLSYYYDPKKALEIIKCLINTEVDFLPKREKSYLKSLTKYLKACRMVRSKSCFKALSYILALDHLSEKNLGVFKDDKQTFVSYTITNPKVNTILKMMWAKQQYQVIGYKLNSLVKKNPWSNSILQEKKSFKQQYESSVGKNAYISPEDKIAFQNYFSNEELIKRYDLEDMKCQLKNMLEYTPLSYTSDEKLKSLETIIVPKVMRSSKLLFPIEIEVNEYTEPEKFTSKDTDGELKNLITSISQKVDGYLKKSIQDNNPYMELISSYSKNRLKNNDLFGLTEYIDQLIQDPKVSNTVGIAPMLNTIKSELSKINQIFLTAFKTSEYLIYNHLTKYEISPFKEDIFFCKEDFGLEALYQKPISSLVNINKNSVYQSLQKNSKLYKNTKKIRPRSSSGSRHVISSGSDHTVKTYIVLDKNFKFLYADFSKNKACKYLCDYAFNNEGFKLKNGITPVKHQNKGVYNPSTFRKDYYPKKSSNKTVDNYHIEELDVNIQDYKDYIDSL